MTAALVAATLLAAVAALHRPLPGATVGLGAIALAPVAHLHGVVAASAVAAAGFLVAALARRAVTRRRLPGAPLAPVRWALAGAATAGAAALAGAAAWRWAAGVTPALAAGAWAAAAHVAAGGGIAWGVGRARGVARPWHGLALDAAGWMVGAVLAVVASAAGWRPASALAVAVALLAAEAARQRLLRAVSESRAGRLDELHGAQKRLLAETGMAGIAARVLAECRDVVPVAHFQLELRTGEGRRSWAAGPDGDLHEGEPTPPALPPALPGIHRRAPWRVLERGLEAGGETLAVLRLWCDPRRLEPRAEELLGRLVPQMASSLHRALLDREAKLDPLTQLPLRRVLESRLAELYHGVCEEGGTMAVVMADVDHFKRINDTHGHAAGDAALVAVARALEAASRDGDLACRYGGEEFTVLLPATGGPAALEVAERLRRAVAAIELEHDGRPVPLRLSAGVAAFPELCARSASELLLLADEALYQAKERGRDRAVLALGGGAYRDAQGRGDATAPRLAAPRIFS